MECQKPLQLRPFLGKIDSDTTSQDRPALELILKSITLMRREKEKYALKEEICLLVTLRMRSLLEKQLTLMVMFIQEILES